MIDAAAIQNACDAMLKRQTDHPVWPKLEVHVEEGGDIVAKLNGREVERFGAAKMGRVGEMFDSREKAIKLEREDPYNYGYEPPFWGELDWFIARMRADYPGEVVEVCIFGGNRAGKTDYCAKRMIEVMDMNPNWLMWNFHTDQKSSRAVQQERVWGYMPLHRKPAEGKVKKNVRARMNYNAQSGFTENGFALDNGSRCEFKFYSGDADSLEGDQPGTVWSDERIPLEWVKAIAVRLITRASQTGGLCEDLKAAIAKHDAGDLEKIPRALRCRMWQGVHIVSFTPLDGVTPAVSRFTKGARTIKAQEGKQLPIIGEGNKVTGYEMMPRLVQQDGAPRGAAWFFNEDNRHGGGHKTMVAMAKKEQWGDDEKKIKLYGFTEKTVSALFTRFNTNIHVRQITELPKDGTWYHIVDPCNGRNWCMGWFKVDQTNAGWLRYEWPPVNDYVPTVGTPGEWVQDSAGKRMDGDKGPAQEPFGWGCERYAEEIARVEEMLFRAENPQMTDEQCEGRRIEIFLRVMDSRYGVQPNATQTGTISIIELMEEHDLFFEPSGTSIVAEGEVKTRVSEGYHLINSALDYDETLARRDEETGILIPDPAQAPHLYICANCLNARWVLENFTGLDGQGGAGKDVADILRYFTMLQPVYVSAAAEWGIGGSGGY